MKFSRANILWVACLSLAPAFSGSAADARLPSDLAHYDFPYSNGLYATIIGFVGLKDTEAKNQKSYKLKVQGFKQRVPVRAVVQGKPAPLVVVIPGLDGKADGKLGRLWPSWLAQAGWHVLTFDSTFLPSFVELSG